MPKTVLTPSSGTGASAAAPPAWTGAWASGPVRWAQWACLLVPLGYLWFRLVNNLRIEWATNPQYSYGWIVPFLCLGLVLRRSDFGPKAQGGSLLGSNFSGAGTVIFLLLAFLYLPIRLTEEAVPEWRPVQWALGMDTVGLTLCLIYISRGKSHLRQLAFPICFFFVAIPWPTPVEEILIQWLTRVNSTIVVELLGWMGFPAALHGNLIEVGTGTVGVNEACSGIRSFQTSLMISLFFGEFYRMTLMRRLILIPAGFILAMVFNVCRMLFLTTIAAKKGVEAIAQYHDPAGVMIALVCTAGLWGLAMMTRNSTRDPAVAHQPRPDAMQSPAFLPRFLSAGNLGLTLLVWLIAVEIGSELWYRNRESHTGPVQKWTVQFPTNNPSFATVPIDADTKFLLRFDEGQQANWTVADGSHWQAYYFDWLPGRVAGYLAKRHTPEICLTAEGLRMISGPQLDITHVNGIALPIRGYVFGTENDPLYVFHCRWEGGAKEDAYVSHESARINLIRGIWAGRGNKGQKILEVIISGASNAAEAKAALTRELKTMIKVEKKA